MAFAVCCGVGLGVGFVTPELLSPPVGLSVPQARNVNVMAAQIAAKRERLAFIVNLYVWGNEIEKN
jgi:hypothetical protein